MFQFVLVWGSQSEQLWLLYDFLVLLSHFVLFPAEAIVWRKFTRELQNIL